MASGFNPSQQPYQPPESQENDDRPAEDAKPVEKSETGASLDDVVRETLQAQSGQKSLAPEVWDGFLAVARRQTSSASLTQPIAEELVDVVLRCRLDSFRQQPEARAAAVRRIAETLWSDTPSRTRLDRLWQSLREEAP